MRFPAESLWRRSMFILIWLAGGVLAREAQASSDRLLGTGGVMEIEGSGGGGLTPWALIAGLGTDSQMGASAGCTRIQPQHFSLTACALALAYNDRVELSFARQWFDLEDVAPGRILRQDIIGAKVRILGDAVYDQDRLVPQIAVGLQYKANRDFDFVPKLVGARRESDADFYLCLTKAFLAGPFGRTWVLDGTLRATRANQFGILGFGSYESDRYSYVGEGSAAVFLTDAIIAGLEYRQKPNNLPAFHENDAHDAFLAWFPTKFMSVTGAYVDLGTIATHADERAWYLSVQTNF